MSRLDRLAARCAVPVFVAHGRDQAPAVERLSLTNGVRLMSTPRHASILLVAGDVRAGERALLARVHDQLAHPRATLWWGAEPNAEITRPRTAEAATNPESIITDLYHDLLSGDYASEKHWLKDQPPNPWRGKGDHGQGGEGMMGGVPYGRMMPMPPTPDIRNGLALDIYTTRIGPFLPQWPSGLVLDITLQGDIVQSASIVSPPYPPADHLRAPFDRVLHEPTPLADIERAPHTICYASPVRQSW